MTNTRLLISMSMLLVSPGLMASPIRYVTLHGSDIQKYDAQLSPWRCEFFAEYPYLFQPSDVPSYHEVQHENVIYESSPQTIMVCAFDDNELIGCLVGLPLKDYHVATSPQPNGECYLADTLFRDIQTRHPYAFYMSELLIKKEYRSSSLVDALYHHIEQAVHTIYPACTELCMLKIEADENNPLCPQDYEALPLTERLEYTLLTAHHFSATSEYAHIIWNTIRFNNISGFDQHTLRLWTKPFSN